MGQPQKWGAFSYDSERRMHLDERSSKKFRNPFTPTASDRYPKEIDLNYGFEKYIPSYLAPDRLDALLEVLRSRGDEDKNLAAQLEANQLLTFRGIMTKICTMLYDDREGFDFNAQLVCQSCIPHFHFHSRAYSHILTLSSMGRCTLNSTAAKKSMLSKCEIWKTLRDEKTRTKVTVLNPTARLRQTKD